MYLRAFTFTF